ncbi:MAG: hypothetical protein JSU96_16350, partial [Acidobacteriota bacterium]
MMYRTLHAWVLLLLLSVPSFASKASNDAVENDPIHSITAQEMKSTIQFLAADEFEGRDALSQANRIAGLYLAHQLDLMGLEPAGDDGTFFQKFTLIQSSLGTGNRMSFDTPNSLDQKELLFGDEFYPATLSASGKASGPLVFAGYGITAPELGYNDYQDISVEGKIVVIFAGEPAADNPASPFDGVVNSGFSELHNKIRTAQEYG